MARKTKAYVDSAAFIAFRDRSDSYHPLFAQLFSDPPQLVTSSLVIAETHGWFLKRYDSQRALQFLDFIALLKPLQVLDIGEQEVRRSTQLLKKFSDQAITLVDACGLLIMKERRIHSCWSTDHHMNLTGVPLIIYPQ